MNATQSRPRAPESSPDLPRPPLPAAVFGLALASFFTDIGSEMIFPLLPAFLATLGGSAVYLGLVEGVADAVSSLLKLASGYVADRTARRKPLVFMGYAIAALARPLVGFASAPLHVLLVRVTDRVGKGIRTSPRDAMIAAAAPEGSEGRAFGLQRGFDHAGAVTGPLVASLLLAYGMPLRHVFFAACVPGFIALLCVALVREPARVVQAAPAALGGAAVAQVALPRSLKQYLAIVALFSLGGSSDAFLLLRARELGVEVPLIPILWSVCHVSKVMFSYVGGGLADRMPRARLIAGGWVVYALTYLGLGFAAHTYQVWLLFIFYGCYTGLTEPAERALVQELTLKSAHGRAFGYFNFVLGVMAIPAGLLTGAMWSEFGAPAALSLCALMAGVAACALLFWDRARQQ